MASAAVMYGTKTWASMRTLSAWIAFMSATEIFPADASFCLITWVMRAQRNPCS